MRMKRPHLPPLFDQLSSLPYCCEYPCVSVCVGRAADDVGRAERGAHVAEPRRLWRRRRRHARPR
eukprot:6206348-Pleurochrysis_carterae.AAC.3